MNPQITFLSDYQWLMLSDIESYEIPKQVLNTEPLSLNYLTVFNQPEVTVHRIQPRL